MKGVCMTTAIVHAKALKSKKSTKKETAMDPVRKAAVDALRGLCSDMDYSVDEYLREKHAGVDAENAMEERILREKEKAR
jgi:hypothetical protein